MTDSYETKSGIVMPCRRKEPVQRKPDDKLGCTNTQCIFHPERGPHSAGTLGICDCPGEHLTKAEQEYIRKNLLKASSE